jgi:hypothetical protein
LCRYVSERHGSSIANASKNEFKRDPVPVRNDGSRSDEDRRSLTPGRMSSAWQRSSPRKGELGDKRRSDPRDSSVVIEVRDSGCGIAAEDRGHIFDMFRRGDTESGRYESGNGGGVGLGLTLVREMVAAHDSDISVQSVVNLGTAFSFPLSRADKFMRREYAAAKARRKQRTVERKRRSFDLPEINPDDPGLGRRLHTQSMNAEDASLRDLEVGQHTLNAVDP